MNSARNTPESGRTPVIRLAARGDGATADGRFVAGAVPGDWVAPDGSISPGPDHRVPACRHFGHCGGCQLQHVSDRVIADFTRERILAPLAAAGIVPAQVMPVHMSAAGARRRAAMRATRRDGQVRIGFNARAQHSLVDMAECPVLHPALFALVAPLRTLLGPHLAERSAIGITMTLTDDGVDLLLSNLQASSLPVIEGLSRFAADHGLARLSVDGPFGVETVAAPGSPSVRLGGTAVTLPPAAFLQATADGEAALVAAVRAIVGDAPRIVDLFAGVGTFALALAGRARVHAVEGAGPAIDALQAARHPAVSIAHRDLFRRPLTAAELARFDAAVIDPPRAGAIAQTQALAASGIAAIAAVSCNPATFARDAERLAGAGYALCRLWPIAQFRWSTHVELAAEFRRPN